MNTIQQVREKVSFLEYALTAATTLIVLGGFFVLTAQAAQLYSNESVTLDENSTEFESEEIDTSEYQNLTFSFDYESEGLDDGDSFVYGWRTGGDDNDLGTISGADEGEGDDEIGSVSETLPEPAQAANLTLYVKATVNAGDDVVNITNMTLTGDEIPPAALIGDDEYDTIEDALTAAEGIEGEVTIEIQSGTYDGFAVDVEEVVLNGNGATIEGQINVSAANVTIDGFVVNNPTAGYGIVVKGVSNVTITDNTLENIGTSHGTNTAQAIYISDNNVSEDFGGIIISDNTISNVGHSTAKTSKGIYIGDSQATVNLTSIEITDNEISGVSANNTAWASGGTGGQGSYGILTNFGVSSTGSTNGLVVSGNTISDLSGLWVHAIGLEGETPDAEMTENEITDLQATKGDTVDTSDFRDEVGVFFEGNTNAPSVEVSGNELTDMHYGVALHSSLDLGEESVLADGNWWGDATGPHGTGSAIVDGVTVNSWLDAADGSDRDHNVLVGAEKYNSIQTAINAASTTAEAVLEIGAGTYHEHLTIDKEIILKGVGDSSDGTVIYVAGTGDAIDIEADNVELKDIRVEKDDQGKGIEIVGATRNDITLDGVTITGTVNGLRIGSGVNLDGLTISDSHFDGNEIGWYFSHESAQGTTVTNVEVTDSTFNNNTRKGIYVEKLENAVFDGLTVSNSGTDSTYNFNNGIDINLKWGDYENIEIKNTTVSGSGLAGPSSPFDPAGLTIKARDDGSYGSTPATLTGVTLTNVKVSGGVVGVRFGEEGKDNATPSDVTVTSSSLRGTGGLGLIDATQGTTTATHNYWGTSSNDSSDIESHIEGNVTFTPWYLNAARNLLSTSISDGSVNTEEDVELGSDEEEEEGEASLPSGTSEIRLAANKVLKVTSSVKATSTVQVNNKDKGDTQTVGGTQVKVTKAVKLKSGVSDEKVKIVNKAVTNVEVELEDNTTIYASEEWNGEITPPTQSTGSGSAPSGFSVGDTVIEVGSPDSVLIFDKPAVLTLEGVEGSVGYKPAGSDTWVEITERCEGTYTDPEAPEFPGECSISEDGNTKIITFHFTQFGALVTQNSTSRTPSGFVSLTQSGSVSAPQGQVLGATTGYQFGQNLARGMSGDDVTALQNTLTNAGVYSGPVTGYFGVLTEEAVRKYQEKWAINQVGIVGPLTRAQLNGTRVLTTAEAHMILSYMHREALRIQALIAEL